MFKTWISYTGLSDFQKCKKSYYYRHIYKNPKTGKKIQIVNPYLSLGSAVHETIEDNKDEDLLKRFKKIWRKYKGKKGGFAYKKQEDFFKKRGEKMIKTAQESEILKKPNFKKKSLPKMPLFKDVELVGSIDWIEVLSDNSFHIIDFKTGKNREKEASLQLFIYYLLACYNYKRKIKRASYWYLDRDSEPIPKEIKNIDKHLSLIKKQALEIKKAVSEDNFSCNFRNCFYCRDFNNIFSGRAEYVGYDEKMNKELYYIAKEKDIVAKVLEEDFLDDKEKEMFQRKRKINSEKEKDQLKKKLKENLDNKELKALFSLP